MSYFRQTLGALLATAVIVAGNVAPHPRDADAPVSFAMLVALGKDATRQKLSHDAGRPAAVAAPGFWNAGAAASSGSVDSQPEARVAAPAAVAQRVAETQSGTAAADLRGL